MDKKQQTILIVEDSPEVLKVLGKILTFKGYRVITATNGVEAVEQFRKVQADLIIVDILLPIMDGAELITNLRKEFSNFKSIGISAMTKEVLKDSTEYGTDLFLVKPFSNKQLLKSVELLLKE